MTGSFSVVAADGTGSEIVYNEVLEDRPPLTNWWPVSRSAQDPPNQSPHSVHEKVVPMTIQRLFGLLALAAVVVSIAGKLAAQQPTTQSPTTQTLVSFGEDYQSQLTTTSDATAQVAVDKGAAVLQVATGHKADWPGITIKAPNHSWDLSAFPELVLNVTNLGSEPIAIFCRVDSPGGDGVKNCVTENIRLQPSESKELVVTLRRQLPAALAEKLFGMRGYPGGYEKEKGLDASQITQLIIFVSKPTQDHRFQIGAIRAQGTQPQAHWLSISPDQFFPMIDQFGQFKHADWPGKIHGLEELKQNRRLEQVELAEQSGPAPWNQYGGCSGGPQLKSTGFFYTTKYRDKWWLVDPSGRLFWSHGVDCVGFSQGTTPITDREFYFTDLPGKDSPFSRFYGQASWAPHNYYEDKGTYRTFNFAGANLLRKYGDDFEAAAADTIHKRLRSWSMNTIANWSDSQIYLLRRTPYVVSAGSGGAKPIEGSSGYWGKFPDPFDPSFRAALDRRMNWEQDKSAGDPWCIGYFVDNELAWGDELSLAKSALASPPEQPAKQAFLADLKTKYQTIEKLNESWATAHQSWEALAESRTPPDDKQAKEDLGAFYTRIAEEYFRNCREAVKAVAPDNLYLGCRFAWVNDRGARAAAKYCDVIGYNLYRDDVADFQLPDGIDLPAIIGEFHFGALDRGMFHTGLRPTSSQQARADAYCNYVTGALKNPCLVGTHWFQYSDQATTGRGDGENYQIGLVDICDTPYAETIQAVRDVGSSMYQTRLGEH